MTGPRKLVFVSPRFLFPADSGGKIRTTQILRGLKGGNFRIELLMPSSEADRLRYRADIDSVCDQLTTWESSGRSLLATRIGKAFSVFHRLPVPVVSDIDRSARRKVTEVLEQGADVVVFDFPHSAVLAPESISVPSVMFTHNIEAEIFKRHVSVARNPLIRAVWKNQYRKMLKFERETLRRFDGVVAVSERDSQYFQSEFGIDTSRSIPTGVDTDFFQYVAPQSDSRVVFCGSMDWMANIDGVQYFHDEVWPLVRREVPTARMKVVGRKPPEALVRRIRADSEDWEFTGFVDDVRDHVAGAAAFVIPLRVGGGTRIKAFEAMAMGTPVVATSIGIEGLPVDDGVHYLNADTEQDMANKVVELLHDAAKRVRISEAARNLVETEFGFRNAAAVFEEICMDVLERARLEQ